jgi:NMD protein affecting ribosome stability and mRNA decay
VGKVCDNCGVELTPENASEALFLPLCQECYEEAEGFVIRPKGFTITSVRARE